MSSSLTGDSPSHQGYGSTSPSQRRSAPDLSDANLQQSPQNSIGRRISQVLGLDGPIRGQIDQLRDGYAYGLETYSSNLNILLISVPIAILAYFLKWGDTVIFISCFMGMIPLAMLLGKATEDIAEHTNETLGAFVNVTFGNAVELILSISALRAGKMQLIKDTIAGSILSNLLLVLGSAFFFGGLNYHEQEVLPAVSEANADLLSFAVFGLSVPSLYSSFVPESEQAQNSRDLVSLLSSIGLLVIYSMYLFFQMRTHADLYDALPDESDALEPDLETSSTQVDHDRLPESEQHQTHASRHQSKVASLPVAVGILVWMVIWVAILSELLVDSIDSFSAAVGLRERFIAVILLPVVGNAVEHMSAVIVAQHNKIDLSIGIACGSSVQIALFAAPVLVVISWLLGSPHLMLNFEPFEIVIIGFSVFVVNATMRDSRTNWLEGAVLIMCYIIVATAYFFII